ncbi:MAG: hypothetical protein ACFFD4_09640 [Candidatus Odinarchaeota archaeon]
MPRKKLKTPEDQRYDQIAKYLFKGTLTQVRKKLRSRIFQEWLDLHPDIVEKALAPLASKETDIIQIITNIILEKQEITLKELLLSLKSRTTVRTQKAVKPLLPKLQFPSNYTLTYPKSLKGSSILKLEKRQIPSDQFLFQLRRAYETAPSKMGDMIEIPILAEILSKNTGWEIDQIYRQIYQVYLEKKVDLQPGKAINGKPLESENGSRFYWFQFR